MERARRAPVGTFYAPGEWRDGARVELAAAAVHHASVKRIAIDDPVRLTNGAGRRAEGRVSELSKHRCVITLRDAPVEDLPAPASIELWCPVGDRDRMLMLAEKSAELGISSWRPIIYARSRSVSPRGEGEPFREKVRLRQVSALEQSGGAWLPLNHVEMSLEAVLSSAYAETGGDRILLDVEGDAIGDVVRSITGGVTVAMGPEGGLEERERSALIERGWRLASLGNNILRFETAGIAALAVLRSHLPSSR
ncbi:MAG: 16S rRNA (uracil(1498)-N(3))-methyltransferase [Gemmatimonadota bacterium]|nr:16S rRNA (uracil(1498)-N(3))-methyltransferase [Gemmatimonadota bacterium]